MAFVRSHTALGNKTAVEKMKKKFRKNHKSSILANFYKGTKTKIKNPNKMQAQINDIVIGSLVETGTVPFCFVFFFFL